MQKARHLLHFGLALAWVLCCALSHAREAAHGGAKTSAPTTGQLMPQGRVTDAAHILDKISRDRLSARLAQYEDRTKHQIVIVTTPDLHGQDVATYTLALANRGASAAETIMTGLSSSSPRTIARSA
jgi:uncharacterized membrane protein YgcG